MRPAASMSGLPELPPTMSLLVDRLNGVARSSVARAARQLAGTANGGWPVARSNKRSSLRERRDGRSVLDPALHGPEVEPQRERGVGIDAGAEDGEARACDVLVRRLDDGFDLVLVPSAQLARFRIELPCQHDERIVRGIDRGLAAVPQLHADGRVGELRAVDEPCGECVGRFGREQTAHDRRVGAQPLAHALERERQRQAFELGIDRQRRRKLLLQARQEAVRELAQPLAVRLRPLGGGAHQRARVAGQAAIEAGAALEELVGQPARRLPRLAPSRCAPTGRPSRLRARGCGSRACAGPIPRRPSPPAARRRAMRRAACAAP